MVLTDVSGATATEYCLIAAGVGFAVTLAMLPHRASRLLYAFDLMELDGDDLRSLPIETRKATLASLLRNPGAIRLSEHISADGPEVFAHACRLGAEGIVSKRLGSPYRSGLCDAWIKCKNPLECAVNPALQLR